MSTRRPTPDSDDALLLRRLHGELAKGALRELERRLAAEPALRARQESLRAAWNDLDLPAVAAPPGFRTRLVALAGAERRGELSWALAPAWARAGAAAMLVVGMVLGAGFGQVGPPSPSAASVETAELEAIDFEAAATVDESAELALFTEPVTLAESFWLSFESEEETP